MEKFTKTNAEKYIRTTNDAQVAQLGHLNALVDSLNNMSSTLQGFKSDFVEGTLGPKVSFEKTYGGTEKDIIIPGVLELTRPNSGNGGLINAAIENSFISGVSPQNTAWCSKLKTISNPNAYSKNSGINYGWAAISNVRNFDYAVWISSFETQGWGAVPNSMVTQNLEFVMRHAPTDRYWLIKFKSWGQGNPNDRSFSYDRWEVFPKTDFIRPANSPSTVDVISSGTILKRDDSQDLLYNAAKETQSAYTPPPVNPQYQFPKSPLGTLWNSKFTDGRKDYNGWSNLSTVKNRIYGNLWGALADDAVNIPDNLELVMLDQATGYYYTVQFTNWSTNGDGAVSYTRRLIPMITSIDFKDSVINGGGGAIDYAAIANNMHFDGYEFYVEKTFPAEKIENMKGVPLELLPNLALNNQYYDFKVLFEFKAGNLLYADTSNPYEVQYGPNVIATYPVTTLRTSCSFAANSSVSLPSGAATNRILVQGSNTKVVFTVNPGSTVPLGGDGVLKAKVFYNIYSIT